LHWLQKMCPTSDIIKVVSCCCFWQYPGLNSGLLLVRQALHHSSHAPSLFTFRYFSKRSQIWAQDILDCDPPIYASHVAGITGTHLLLLEMGSCEPFFPKLALNLEPTNLRFLVANMGMSHHPQP
jgi:hypothetical protein